MKIILVDLNQVIISALMAQIGNHKNAEIDENMLRHMVLNILRSYNVKYKSTYGDMIICVDSRNSWRKKAFPYYKASRKQSREESELDWNIIFQFINTIKEEIDTFLPYKVIAVESAEADDIIGTIVHHEGNILNTGKKILILSGDKDFIQLHKYGNVSQYDGVRKKVITHSNPSNFLIEHIIKGDQSDGVPNIFSNDNVFVIKQRQNSVTAKRIDTAMSDLEKFKQDNLRNWTRNSMLIDLSNTPNDIQTKVLVEYEKPNLKNRSKLMEYFMSKHLKLLIEFIGDF